MAELPQELQQQLDEYQKLFAKRTDAFVKKAMELNRQGPGSRAAMEPTPGWPPYPWLNIFLVGPIQTTGYTGGPYKPSKIIAFGETAYMFVALWRNPAPISWIPGNPSACNMLNGVKFRVNFEVVDLTSVSNGPDLPHWSGTFANYPNCIQWHCVEMSYFPIPQEGIPNLYELYATIDVVGPQGLPIAGFTSWVFDPDFDPHWLFFPDVGPHWQYERPVQFMVYKR